MILLTFNIVNIESETKNNIPVSDEVRLKITEANTRSILRILDIHETKATFFIEISITEKLHHLVKSISVQGHEIAFYNKNADIAQIEKIKNQTEYFLNKQIRGIRQKEISINVDQLKLMGFSYISNIDHADILFPLKRLKRVCEIVEENGVSIIPESISPYSQLPYNDFIFQILPMKYYQNMVFETLKNDEFVLIYLDSWQFTDIKKHQFKVPLYRKYNSGKKMEDKLEEFLSWLNGKEMATSRMKDYLF